MLGGVGCEGGRGAPVRRRRGVRDQIGQCQPCDVGVVGGVEFAVGLGGRDGSQALGGFRAGGGGEPLAAQAFGSLRVGA